MTPLPDPEIDALHIKLAALEARVADLAARRMEMEQLVQQFQYRQYQVLGERLIKNLRLRHECRRLGAERSGLAEDRDAEAAAAAELEDFLRSGTVVRKAPPLAEEDRHEIRSLYRAVAMRCHPDRVPDKDKAAAHELFLRIQSAYRENDLQELQAIRRLLAEEGDAWNEPPPAGDRERLQRLLSGLYGQAADLILAIQTLRLDVVYRRALRADDWDDYFASVRDFLDAESGELERQIRAWSSA